MKRLAALIALTIAFVTSGCASSGTEEIRAGAPGLSSTTVAGEGESACPGDLVHRVTATWDGSTPGSETVEGAVLKYSTLPSVPTEVGTALAAVVEGGTQSVRAGASNGDVSIDMPDGAGTAVLTVDGRTGGELTVTEAEAGGYIVDSGWYCPLDYLKLPARS
jgi:hypothetical protein